MMEIDTLGHSIWMLIIEINDSSENMERIG
jgi:hypothetical protein